MKKSFGIFVAIAALLVAISGSIIVSRVFVAFLFVLCILLGRKESSFLNPYYLFSVTPLSLLIYVDISGNFMMELTAKTWGLAIINITAFILAVYYSSDFKSLKNCTGPSDKKLIIHTLILTAIGLFSVAFEYFMDRPFFLASVLKLCSVPAIICALKSKRKILIIIVMALFVGSSIGFLSKSAVLTYLIALLIGIEKYYIRTKRERKSMAVFSAIGVFVMIISFTFANKDRGTRNASDTVDYYEQYGNVEWNSPDALFMPYMYLTTPWANLQYLTETQDERTYGMWLIKPLLGYLQLDEHFQSSYRMRAYSTFNTFTFVSCNFKDFGYWLSIISSVFLGFFVKKVYSRYRRSRSALDVACYVYVGLAVLEMFFSNEFFTQSFPFTIVIIMALYKLFFFHNQRPQLEE